ncbi:TBC1 domain family member 20-like [Ruditapes philippinarum]|uniref:TBC1 domain family member 20-like n=1 Tax=Ruditapes philippinarum TaxID=129788 RepID=UPI00295B0F3C|nr:TBC1 domain family member 20-like [Ruditapes philippinarum]
MKLENGSTTELILNSNELQNEVTDLDEEEKYGEKIHQIKELLAGDNVDIKKLQEFAISPGGFVTNEIRQEAWPKLVGIDVDNIPPKPDEETLHGHRDYNQVVLDVNRSLKRFPPDMDDNIRLGLQDQLVDLIMRVLVRHDELHYYQGYHDICVTFLLVGGEDVAFALVDKLSLNHLRDFMDANMDRTKHILNYMYPLIGRVNPKLRDFLERSEVGTIFSLSWLITWYGHVLPHLRDIVRCYDFFIACHPLMPIYLAAAIVLYREKEILEAECDMCVLHGLLSKIPDDIPYEQLIVRAVQLYEKYSPDDLAHEAILNFKRSQELAKARIQNRQRPPPRPAVKRKRWLSLFYQDGSSIYFKLTFWTLTAVFSAALIAYFKSSEWDKGWWS